MHRFNRFQRTAKNIRWRINQCNIKIESWEKQTKINENERKYNEKESGRWWEKSPSALTTKSSSFKEPGVIHLCGGRKLVATLWPHLTISKQEDAGKILGRTPLGVDRKTHMCACVVVIVVQLFTDILKSDRNCRDNIIRTRSFERRGKRLSSEHLLN